MKVTVTQDHIDNGVKHSTITCPIALATKDLLDSVVSVGATEIHTWDSVTDDMDTYSMPAEAKRFIVEFDDGHPVLPFEFEAIKVLEPVVKKVKSK